MKTRIITIIIFAGLNLMAGSFSEKETATSTGAFLKIETSPSAIALGGAYSSAGKGSAGIFYNPALLAELYSPEVYLSHAQIFQEMNFNYMVLARPVYFLRGALAFIFEDFRYGEITKVLNDGTEQGTFSPSSSFFALAYARRLFGMNVGATVKKLSQKISDKSASAIAVDFGIKKEFSSDFNLAFSFQNLGTKIKMDKIADSLPFSLRIGLSKKFFEDLLVSSDIVLPVDSKMFFSVGSEYIFYPKSFAFSLRAGYKTLDTIGNLSFGFGLKKGRYSIDYACSPFGILGQNHIVSVNISF